MLSQPSPAAQTVIDASTGHLPIARTDYVDCLCLTILPALHAARLKPVISYHVTSHIAGVLLGLGMAVFQANCFPRVSSVHKFEFCEFNDASISTSSRVEAI